MSYLIILHITIIAQIFVTCIGSILSGKNYWDAFRENTTVATTTTVPSLTTTTATATVSTITITIGETTSFLIEKDDNNYWINMTENYNDINDEINSIYSSTIIYDIVDDKNLTNAPISPISPTTTTVIENITLSEINLTTLLLGDNRTNRNQSININNKSFSMVLLNQFKVSEVFENERKNNINSKISYNNDNSNNSPSEMNLNGKIVILGLFELSTKFGFRPEGYSELGAAQMAVKHINQKQILPGYTLDLVTNDTQCDPGIGVDRFFHALYTQVSTRMVMLLGSACSEVTESLAKVVPYWNIVQVSFGSTSPALSDRHEFPFFYRTVAPDSSHNPARIAFIKKFRWDTVTTFSQNEEVHSLAVNDLVTELESANISCAATITFAETDFKEQLLLLRELDTRIIVGSFSQELAPKIFCEAFKLGMFGADYAWILHEGIGTIWWNNIPASGEEMAAAAAATTSTTSKTDVVCTKSQLGKAVENLIIVSSYNSIIGNEISLSGLNNDMFIRQLVDGLKVPKPLSRYATQTYDAVWAIALALRAAEDHWRTDKYINYKLNHFDYTRSDMAHEFLQQLGKLNFLGVSGPVSFSGPDRIGTTVFYQVQQSILETVALYYPAENNLDFNCPNCKPIKWHSGQVPIARRIFTVKIATISPVAFYTIATLSLLGIALAITFLSFNLHFRKLKTIKLSSAKLNNITAVGCILVYMAVILLGLDYSTLHDSKSSFATVCTARVYLLSAGFSLAFGSMFAKTYRVHRIFTRTGSGLCKDKMLQDTQLISLVCALLLLDGLVVTCWIVTDPIERQLNNLTLQISPKDRSVVYQPQVEVCHSHHAESWLGALYAYKGLLLIIGVYMAWETRHVKIPALNDSKYIGVCVYSVVITSAIVVVLTKLISERVTLAFITISALILASTTATLCLLFLPKLHDIWRKGDIVDPVIHSMGLKMEYNTRRFVIDDRRELQYRVEVQNRVYKKEISTLDAEIHRLEKILDGTSSTTSSSNPSLKGQPKPEVVIFTAETLPGATSKSRTPSISGGLPYLLLSVLPPVIPRASWPSAQYMQVSMRKSVTFASHPQLVDTSDSIDDVCLPDTDLMNLRLAHQQATKLGLINKIRRIFRSTNTKESTNSLETQAAQGQTTGFRAALKNHMGIFSRFIPPTAETTSCNTIFIGNTTPVGVKPLQKSSSLATSGSNLEQISSAEKLVLSKKKNLSSLEIRTERSMVKSSVNFQFPPSEKPTVTFSALNNTVVDTGAGTNIYQKRTTRFKGSPRFPHRIVPTCSLSALEEKREASDPAASKLRKLGEVSTSTNWKSMAEVTSTFSLNYQCPFNDDCNDQKAATAHNSATNFEQA